MTWQIIEDEKKEEIIFISSKNYTFIFKNIAQILNTLELLSAREVDLTISGDRLQIDYRGIILVIDNEPWINPSYDYGDEVCHSKELSAALCSYLRKKTNKIQIFK